MPDPVKDRYPDLSSTFFRGSLIGQIRSAYKARFDRPGKVADFKRAIEAGEVVLDPAQIPQPERVKLAHFGIEIPTQARTPDTEPAAPTESDPVHDAVVDPDGEGVQ